MDYLANVELYLPLQIILALAVAKGFGARVVRKLSGKSVFPSEFPAMVIMLGVVLDSVSRRISPDYASALIAEFLFGLALIFVFSGFAAFFVDASAGNDDAAPN